MSKLAQGTNVFKATVSNSTVVEVTEVEAIEMGKPTKDKLEVTPLSERTSKQFKSGLNDEGEGTITIFVDSEEVSHMDLYAESKKTPKEDVFFAIGWSDGDEDIVPTFDATEKKWILPEERTWNVFNAEIAVFPFSYEKQGIVKTEISMTRRGESDWIPMNESRTDGKLWKRA